MPPQYQPYPQTGYVAPPPGAYPPYGQPQPPQKSRAPLIAGIIAGILLLCLIACGAVAYAANNAMQGFNSSFIPMVMATETALAQNGGQNITYQDTMTDSPVGWTTDTHCALKTDGYHAKGGGVCVNPNLSADDGVTITVTSQLARSSASAEYGIVFRQSSQGNYYAFVITTDGRWILLKMVNGTPATLAGDTASTAIVTGKGAINTLAVQLLGTSFTCIVNGKQVGSGDDGTFSSGSAGVLNQDTATTSEVVFTSFTVAQANSI